VIIRIRVFWDVTHYAPIRKMDVAVSSKLHSIMSWETELFNPLNAELNPICHLLALLGSHPILHVSRIRVNYILVVIQRIGILHTHIHPMDLEITVDIVCAIGLEAQNVQISTVQSIINRVAPEVDCSQHGVSCSEN
jgi:hypothetical protein